MTADDGAALDTAKAFIDAIAWGEHRRVWELLGHEGRTTVLRVAATRGMDQGLATRLLDGTASAEEQEEFLGDLLNGLRADLAGNDLDTVKYTVDPEGAGPGKARVKLLAALPEPLAVGGHLPVGTVELVDESGDWRVDRLVPQMSR